MIVVDTNVVAYLYLPGAFTAAAERLLEKEPQWVVPLLWRSELRNVLALYLRQQVLTLDDAYAIQSQAESLLAGHEYDVDSHTVLRLAAESSRSAYDCEFIALARRLKTPFVTEDGALRKAFPQTAISLADALGASPRPRR